MASSGYQRLPVTSNGSASVTHPQKRCTNISSSYKTALALTFSIILNATLLVEYVLNFNRQCENVFRDPSRVVYSPAQEAIEYIPQKFKRGFGTLQRHLTPYQGWPDDEKDRLWKELYEDVLVVHINASDNEQLPEKTEKIPIPGREHQYIASIDVFHQLHCLDAIRKQFYPRRYNTSMAMPDGVTLDYEKWMHMDHCIESIRQSLTCNSDVAALSWEWLPVKMLRVNLEPVHTCRNFTKIKEWAMERRMELTNDRAHVENGKIVDYTEIGPDLDAPESLDLPRVWKYRLDEM